MYISESDLNKLKKDCQEILDTPSHKTIKPKLEYKHGRWLCADYWRKSGYICFGETPEDAYDNWYMVRRGMGLCMTG